MQDNLTMFFLVCKRYKLQYVQVFVLAYIYYQDKSHDKNMDEFYREHCREGRAGVEIPYKLPEAVDDYVLNILAGRIYPPRMLR